MSAFDPGATKILQRAIGRYVPIVLQSRFALVIKKSKSPSENIKQDYKVFGA